MNAIFQLVIATFLLVQLSTTAFIPFRTLMNRAASNRRTLANEILSNYDDEYEEPYNTAESEVLKSTTCAYYDYKDDCHNSNDGCGQQTVACPYLNANPACYTVWSGNEMLLQGCWLTSNRQDCTPRQCIADHDSTISISTTKEASFCCCYGDKCNEDYSLSNQIPSWP